MKLIFNSIIGRILRSSLILFFLLSTIVASSQMIGIGTVNPTEKLHVEGKLRAEGIIMNTGGMPYDFLVKTSANSEVGFKKAQGALGLNFIICLEGNYPSRTTITESPMLGEIQVFSGSYAPDGWAFCNGQILSISQNTALFSILGTTYGGNGHTSFALPDLRGAAAVGFGVSVAGYEWSNGEKSN